MTRRAAPIVAAIAMAVLLGACGSSAPADTSAPSSTPADSEGPGATADGPTGGDVTSALDAVTLRSLTDLAAFENALTARVADAAGLPTLLGADTWAWAEGVLRAELAKGGQRVDETAGRTTPPILLASIGEMPPLPATEPAVDGGGGVGLAMAAALVFTGLDGQGLPRDMNLSLDSTQETTANGERTVGTVNGHIQTSTSGSTVTADVEIGVDVTVTDAATGTVKRTASFRSRGQIKLDLCPDSNGKVKGHVTLTIDGGTSGAGNASMTIDAEVEGTVGDDAYLQQVAITGTSTQSATPASGGAARRSVVSAGVTARVGRNGIIDTTGATSTGQVVEESETLSDAEVNAAYDQIFKAAGAAMWLLGDKAQAQWRGGACVEIRATEQSRDVRKNELVQFEARTWHKVEGVELAKTIVADFTGKASLDPVGIEVASPVTLSFKAGPNLHDTGTITLTSTSNRGIGTLSITFRVQGGWIIDGARNGARLHGQKCGDPTGLWKLDGEYTRSGFDGSQTWEITIAADQQTGTFEYFTTAVGRPGGSPVNIYLFGYAKGKVTLSIDPVSGVAHMHLKETKHTYVATTDEGGHGQDQNAPLESYDLDWDVGGNC